MAPSAPLGSATVNSAKKLPLTGLEPLTRGLYVLLTSCVSYLTTVLDPIT